MSSFGRYLNLYVFPAYKFLLPSEFWDVFCSATLRSAFAPCVVLRVLISIAERRLPEVELVFENYWIGTLNLNLKYLSFTLLCIYGFL